MVECAFGILCNKGRYFYRAIDVRPVFCDVIVKNCCALHNFVRQKEGFQFQDTLFECPLDSVEAVSTRGNVTGTDVREYFAKCFTSPQDSVPWQYGKFELLLLQTQKLSLEHNHFTAISTVYCAFHNKMKVYFTWWLQGILYFTLSFNFIKVCKETLKEYSTVCTNKLQ
jgi:hypothetical protein